MKLSVCKKLNFVAGLVHLGDGGLVPVHVQVVVAWHVLLPACLSIRVGVLREPLRVAQYDDPRLTL
jgi:hypothetical protein